MTSKVPKFGAWEDGENYTHFFDKARKDKSNGAMINPNDPAYYTQNEQAPPAAPSTHRRTDSQQSHVSEFGARKTKTSEPTKTENINSRGKSPAETQPTTIKPEPQEARSKVPVPQFGAWDGGEVAYTACFETIRKTKNGTDHESSKASQSQLNRDVNPQNEPPTQGVHAKIPQFGAWEGAQNVGYTAYFDTARKNKNEPAEPQMNRDVGERGRQGSGGTKPRSDENMGQGKVRSRPDQRSNREESHLKNQSRGSNGSVAGSEAHHRHPRGGKSQPKSGSRGSQPEKGASIPPFGVWHKDPAQAEGFTGAFELAYENRMTPPNKNTPASHQQSRYSNNQEEKKGCCFSCFG